MRYRINKYLLKKIMLYAMLFPGLLYCMEQNQLINCGLIDIFIPNDLVGVIKSHCTLQDIGRLKSLNKAAYNYWNTENCDCSLGNFSFACQNLKACSYHTRTKALAHYAITKNIKMFEHIWDWEKKLRNEDLQLLHYLSTCPEWKAERKINYYSKYCNTPKEIDRVNCKKVVHALNYFNNAGRELLKKVLQGTGFNIYTSSYRKKRASFHLEVSGDNYMIRKLLSRITSKKDIDLFLTIIGGVIQPAMFKSLFKYLSFKILNALADQGLIPFGEDKDGKTARYYYKKKMKTSRF